MSVTGGQIRLRLFATVLALLCVNASAPWGGEAARWVAAAVQLIVVLGAILAGVVVASRASGTVRAWRALVVAALMFWLLGQVLWWSERGVAGTGTTPPIGVAAYFLPPLLGGAASLVLMSAGGGVTAHRGDGHCVILASSPSSTGWWQPCPSRSS